MALVGNPNSGKTALFNALTGSRQKVANYAGVTVERKEGQVDHAPPAARCRSSTCPAPIPCAPAAPTRWSPATRCWASWPARSAPDVLVCVADATNLRLVLRLILELKAVGRPMVLALNMYDIAQRQGLRIDLEGLAPRAGLPDRHHRRHPQARHRRAGRQGRRPDRAPARSATANAWREPAAGEIRDAHREAQRILKAYVRPPERPDTFTGKVDGGAAASGGRPGDPARPAVPDVPGGVHLGRRRSTDLIEAGFAVAGRLLGARPAATACSRSFITDGLIAGVGSVLVFLPQILILFFFIILLEDFGYMARAAFLMDRIMGGAGLHGRAFIPLLSSFACAIPGIMATRVIDNKRDRLTTILVAPLMTCSARIPVYTLIICGLHPQPHGLGRA